MTNDEQKLYVAALENVLQRLGKAGWTKQAIVGEKALRVRFTTKGIKNLKLLSDAFSQTEWPKNKAEILAFIHLAKMSTRARPLDE